jgi:hypothetical protein
MGQLRLDLYILFLFAVKVKGRAQGQPASTRRKDHTGWALGNTAQSEKLMSSEGGASKQPSTLHCAPTNQSLPPSISIRVNARNGSTRTHAAIELACAGLDSNGSSRSCSSQAQQPHHSTIASRQESSESMQHNKTKASYAIPCTGQSYG